tara:strand:- start:7241 stop:7477 length:237 start_codon:yes stop_codon:yes gene_type:complete
MKFVGRLEKVRKINNKKIQRMQYHRVMIINPSGKIETIALLPLELRKARKRAREGSILQIRPKWYHKIYAYFCRVFGK